MLDKTWSPSVYHTEKPFYKTAVDSINWNVLGYFKKWNLIKLTNKIIFNEGFDDIINIFL